MWRSLFSSLCLTSLLAWVAPTPTSASDWLRFRGPNGNGISPDTTPTPTKWSSTENLKWKAALPGPGSSSPIVVGEKVFVTCWSGYGTDRGNRSGDQEKLKRHLICLDRQTGKTIWDKTVDPYLPEDDYGGMFAEHGYATHTPVSDGERIYVFFGKTGVLAFDLEGNQLWQTSVGHDSGQMGWGSASSPVLYKNLVIVPAAAESHALYGLDKQTGKQVWREEAEGFGSSWGTPILVKIDDQRSDLVVGVPGEIWGFNPETGNLRWFCEALPTRSFCASVVTDDQMIYAIGDQGSGSVAIKPGGSQDITKTHIVWSGRENSRINTPVIADGRMYFFSNRVANCVDTKTGQRVFQGRLSGSAAAAPQNDEAPRRAPGGGRGGRGGGGGGGGMGGQDYASAVVADGKLYYIARNGDAHVLKVSDQFEQLATNRVTDEAEDFSATPAISDGALYIRSSKHLYCVAETGGAQ